MKNYVHAQFINLTDNVPFQRIYRSKGLFVSAYKRMKDTRLDHAIDYRNNIVVRHRNFDTYAA